MPADAGPEGEKRNLISRRAEDMDECLRDNCLRDRHECLRDRDVRTIT